MSERKSEKTTLKNISCGSQYSSNQPFSIFFELVFLLYFLRLSTDNGYLQCYLSSLQAVRLFPDKLRSQKPQTNKTPAVNASTIAASYENAQEVKKKIDNFTFANVFKSLLS